MYVVVTLFSYNCASKDPNANVSPTRTVFHKSRRIFLIGKWGQLPAQYFKIISSKIIGNRSSQPTG